ncbi:MAG: arginine deiminase [Bavariicoccus seileri]|uniref:Arginine deiminase n=1 Tax=Bavariicoccus seileri TaxID=549685 RepID=A0A3D4S406_9ENTE|nr:arginine deiminase [Bavariicoccus seileri]HCS93232.1 arginine deiminase [Bavariicoccus seileri]
MTDSKPIEVYSEIGKLQEVLLHRPGEELENLVPDYLEELLFDDIPFLKRAQEEHDYFAKVLTDLGVMVVYLEDLAAESLTSEAIKEQFLDEFLQEAKISGVQTRAAVRDYLLGIEDNKAFILKTMAGIQKAELNDFKPNNLSDLVDLNYLFAVDPMPNLYFTRDNFATIGHGISLNHMYSTTRNRETIYAKYIFSYHPKYRDANIPHLYTRDEKTRIEGGDELVLSPKVLAVGISQRTAAESIEKLAENLLSSDMGFERVLAFDLAKNRKFMHLDTVFTMIDYDTFTIHPEIEGDLTVYSLTKNINGAIDIVKETSSLEDILRHVLELETIKLIRCGDGNLTAAAREQWNDGSNTLAVAPGEVIVYDRNLITNEALRKAGVTLHEIPGSELVRGRGGPRCMSMPLKREKLI